MSTMKNRHGLGRIVPLVALVFMAALETTWAASKAEVLQPKAGQALSGKVDVQLKLPAKLSGPVYAGLGGPPWVKLEQVADTNEWRGRLNSRMVPNGNHNLIVKTTNKRADTAVSVKVKNPLKVYFADLHSHTGYSDGTLLPVVAHDYARNVAKLDVYSLTDHLEQVDDTEWLDMRESAGMPAKMVSLWLFPAWSGPRKQGISISSILRLTTGLRTSPVSTKPPLTPKWSVSSTIPVGGIRSLVDWHIPR